MGYWVTADAQANFEIVLLYFIIPTEFLPEKKE